MWLLFHIHSDIQQRESEKTELEESLKECQEVVTEKEALLKKAKKDASKARGSTSSKDKLRIKLEAEVDKLQPSMIESSEAIQALKKRVSSDEKGVSKIEKDKASHGKKLSALQAEIDDYTKQERELQKEYDEVKESESGVGCMTEKQEVQYEKVRDAAAVASAAPRRELQTAVRVLENARARAAKVSDEKKELIGRKEDAERSVEELTQRKDILERVSFYVYCLSPISPVFTSTDPFELLSHRASKRRRLILPHQRRSSKPYKSLHPSTKANVNLSRHNLTKSIIPSAKPKTTVERIKKRNAF